MQVQGTSQGLRHNSHPDTMHNGEPQKAKTKKLPGRRCQH